MKSKAPQGPQNPAQLAEVVLKFAQLENSPSGASVSKSEMQLFVDALKLDGVDQKDKDRGLALLAGGQIKLDGGALGILYRELGLINVDPIQPPIVALYGVAINDALVNAQAEIDAGGQPNIPMLQALLSVADQANTDFPRRAMSASPAVMSARPQGVAASQISAMRTATTDLRAFIAANAT